MYFRAQVVQQTWSVLVIAAKTSLCMGCSSTEKPPKIRKAKDNFSEGDD